eukprot:TRINITY_DN20724_c1_g1_i1.p1 TRINITY_DN20724_c1_g1~~TRINITY_DN20724_c1_g1_i1.p1  ORF type:complete len:538 (+),score=74.88 TRINITY_DN20724_c1_g1_i1:85-1698(+)
MLPASCTLGRCPSFCQPFGSCPRTFQASFQTSELDWPVSYTQRRNLRPAIRFHRSRVPHVGRRSSLSSIVAHVVAHVKHDPVCLVYHTGTLASFTGVLMKDILYLRLLSLFGSFCSLTFWATRRPIIWAPIFWGSIFGLANLKMILQILIERAAGQRASPEHRLIYEKHLTKSGMSLRQFLSLMKKARAITVPAGHRLRQASEVSKNFMLLLDGEVAASWGANMEIKRVIDGGHAGGWLGEMGFITRWTRGAARPAPQCVAELTTLTPCNLLVWEDADLRTVLDSDIELRRIMLLFLAETRFRRMLSRSRADEYLSLMKSVVLKGSNVSDIKRQVSREFRLKHNISPWEHEWIVNKLGWKADDWIRGSTSLDPRESAAVKLEARRRGPIAPEPGIILFNDYSSDFSELAPAYPAPFDDEKGVTWASLQHYMEAQKYIDDQLREEIRSLPDALALTGMAEEPRFAESVRPDWKDIQESTMRRALKWKFDQDPWCRMVLKSTGSQRLLFNTPDDYYWGAGGDAKGKNLLGSLLEELRDA